MTLLEPQAEGIPLPHPTPVSQPFWDACKERRLRYQRCDGCNTAIFNPAPVCRTCGGRALTWHDSAGAGTLYSYTIAWRPQSPKFSTPYAPIIVDVDEGFQMLSNLVGCSIDDIRIGMRLQVAFHAVGDATLPYFRPA
jgi:uncharacterized OB-fold protein